MLLSCTPLVLRFYKLFASVQVEELVGKEKEIEEKLMLKHISVVDSYEKKSGARDTETRVAGLQQKLTTLRHELHELLEVLDEI